MNTGNKRGEMVRVVEVLKTSEGKLCGPQTSSVFYHWVKASRATINQSGRDSCSFLCLITFCFCFLRGWRVRRSTCFRKGCLKVSGSTLHHWLLLLNSKEPRCQASSFLFPFMSTVWVLGLSCRQVFWCYHSLLILTFGEMGELALFLLF